MEHGNTPSVPNGHNSNLLRSFLKLWETFLRQWCDERYGTASGMNLQNS